MHLLEVYSLIVQWAMNIFGSEALLRFWVKL